MTLDHEAIEEQAKKIMDSFLKELNEIQQEDHFGVECEKEMREPKAEEPNHNFKQAFFANAPKIRDGQLVAERKQW